MTETITLHHTGFILGVPGEYSPGHYIVENGQIVDFSPLAAPSLELEAATDMLQIAPPSVVVTEIVDEPMLQDLTRVPANNGG